MDSQKPETDEQPVTLGYRERLEEARRRAGVSVHGLHKALREKFPDLRGTSYAGVRHYFDDPPRRPRLELLRAMAEVLGVRYERLAFDQGPWTREEEADDRLAHDATARTLFGVQRGGTAGLLDSVTRGVAKGMGVPPPPSTGVYRTPSWLSSAVHLWSSARHAAFRSSSEMDEVDGVRFREGPIVDEERVAQEVGAALAAPLGALGLSPEDLTEFELRNYVFAMVAALAPVIHHYHGPKEGSNG